MGGTRGLGFVSTADNVIEMSVVRVVKGVGRLCEQCICSKRGRRCGGELVK